MLANALLQIVHDAVPAEELKQSVVYIQPSIAAGETLVINRKQERVETPALLLFIDLEPGVNWGHRCKYILVENEGKGLRSFDGQFPPAPEKLQILVKPPAIEEWRLLSTQSFSGE